MRIRVVSIPVARCLSHEPEQWDKLLRSLWAETTSLANWALLEWIKAEPVREPNQEKMTPLPDVYHYGLLKHYEHLEWWTGAKANANCILQAARKKWLACRYAVVFQRRERPPLFRYPYPYRVHNKSWKLTLDANGQLHLWVVMPGGRVELLLRSGAEYRRQMRQLGLILDGTAKQGELLIDKHRRTGQTICRIVASFPDAEAAEGRGVVKVRTCPDRFWSATGPTGAEWLLNGDHVRRWVVSHAEFLQRISEDTKYEKRWPHRMRRHMDEAREARCLKQNNRLASWVNESCAQLVGWAKRQKAISIEYDDTIEDYMPRFPWFRLRERLSCKCKDEGLEYLYVGKRKTSDDADTN